MPKRWLSQNFLYDTSILKRIIQVAGVTVGDTVVEIGPGPGRLTRLLAERAGRVVAIEIDRELFGRLREELGDVRNVELVLGDALKYPYGGLGPFKVVANIPYHITTPIIFKLLEHRGTLSSMTLTVQKEVAERVAAGPGGKEYGVLSIAVQYYGRAKVKFLIPKGAFRPVPRVDSACLHVQVRGAPPVSVLDEGFFFKVVRTAFGKRRKTIRNALRSINADVNGALEDAGIESSARPETLGMEEFARLSDALIGRMNEPE